MSTRNPASSIGTRGDSVRGADVYPQLQRLRSIPFLDGAEADVTFDGVSTASVVQHRLGRVYRGGIVTQQSGSQPILIIDPDSTIALGYDPTQVLIAIQYGAAVASTAKVWVY